MADSGWLHEWHRDPPQLYAKIEVNNDGTGTLYYGCLNESGSINDGTSWYYYRLRFLVSNRSDIPSSTDEGGTGNKSEYNGTAIIANFYKNYNVDGISFNLHDLGIDTSQNIYFYYFCSANAFPSDDSNYDNISGDMDFGSVWSCDALLTAPSISELTLKNPKSGSTTVSNNPHEISITAEKTGGDDYTKWETWIKGPDRMGDDGGGIYYSYESGDYFNNHYDTFHGLSSRTEYQFAAKMSNAAGDSGWTSTKTFRTLSTAPVLSIDSKSHTLNSVTFNWKSDISLSSITYKVKYGDGKWSSEKQQTGLNGATTGALTFYTEPNTTVYVQIKGTEDWDSISGEYEEDNETTYDKAYIDSLQNSIIHNNGSITITISNPSGNTITLYIKDGDDIIWSSVVSKNTSSITLRESDWDNIYKLYGNKDSKELSFVLVTNADSEHSPSSYSHSVNRTITLTGIQKTAYLGHNGPRRAMVFCGKNNGVKRAVIWVGKSGPKRTI